ncbi:hypothetical protein PoB_006166900 [Plakobranchus ocellatus]|uniref:Uncharacterized protein n=1 Tax=Plakobranchus ocellatus TaxID=259542 RepID=A0AAV4CTD4_9GAST|nr:hypothetical protein PoB_006166900 [Plakobranchus ocellatus]
MTRCAIDVKYKLTKDARGLALLWSGNEKVMDMATIADKPTPQAAGSRLERQEKMMEAPMTGLDQKRSSANSFELKAASHIAN